MRTSRAGRWGGFGFLGLLSLLLLSLVSAGGPVAGAESTTEPIELEVAVWSAGVADAMLLAEPELEENPFAVLVRFVDAADGTAVEGVIAPIAGRVVDAHTIEDGSTVHVVETRVGVGRALEHLRASALVVAAEPDRVVVADALTDDTLIDRQWSLEDGAGIDIEPAWAGSTGATTVVVGVIDSGVDAGHPDLASAMWHNPAEIAGNLIDDDGNGFVDDVHGWDFVDDDADPGDPHGHGTHVAGTIAAIQNNALGVAGVATNVEIMALRFLNADGSGYTSDAIAALEYALDAGVTITNNSWGGGSYSWTLSNLIDAAGNHMFVAAAGNSTLDLDATPRYPASYTSANIVSVASHDADHERSSFSNYGLASVDLSAPGGWIYSTTPGNYGASSGTSMAAPHVAGVAALVRGIDPALSPADVVELLERTSRWDDASVMSATRSGGHLDAGRAVAAAQPDAPSIVLDTAASAPLVGDPLTLTAVAAAAGTGADLTSAISWHVDSVDGAFDGSSIAAGATLTITPAEATRLRVRAEISDGSGGWNVAAWVVDVVDGPPGAPESVRAVGGDGALDVTWDPPADDGGAPISGYIATASPGGASCGTSSTSCTIEDVANGTGYTVSVVAFNGAGEGPGSTPSSAVTPLGPPGAPQDASAEAGDESVTVQWTPPLDDGGAEIIDYVVMLAPSGRTCTTAATTCRVDQLENGRAQSVFVWATSDVGPGVMAEAGTVVPARGHVRCEAVVASSSFEDLPATSFAVADVECLRILGVTNGTSATTFSPTERVTREQMAAFLARLYRQVTGERCAPNGSSFADLSPASFARVDVECLRDLGITNGTSSTTYSPAGAVTREQMGSFLARIYREITGEPCAPTSNSFTDVGRGSFARTDIECLVALGITNGTSATTYSPAARVNREQMAAFLGRLYRVLTT